VECEIRGGKRGGRCDQGKEQKKMVKANYRDNIIAMIDRQRDKGLSKYGEVLEDNVTLTVDQRLEHIQEELIDALMYIEHLRAAVLDKLTANDFQRAAMRTASGMNYDNAGGNGLLLNGVMGLNGESGECIDIMKKHIFQGHELDREHLIEELGDTAWYLAVCCEGLGVSLEEVMRGNIDKLKARYPEGFDKARSINRNGEKTYTFEEVKAELGLDDGAEEKVRRKTYLEDLLERLPGARMNGVHPEACRAKLYGDCECTELSSCEICWNEVMPE
jgi:NTP pyrophosphatase (non-canonical NTP hydrolase)